MIDWMIANANDDRHALVLGVICFIAAAFFLGLALGATIVKLDDHRKRGRG